MRDWVVKRHERTRHLIELGGLVVKSGLVELTNDDSTALYGGFLELVLQLQSATHDQVIALWQRRGARAFKDDLLLKRQDPAQRLSIRTLGATGVKMGNNTKSTRE
jgi:hypothetical protein